MQSKPANRAILPDLAIPYLPQGGLRYLITGRPRIRSAWLAALLSQDKLPCYHDALSIGTIIKDQAFGLSDPAAACTYPNVALTTSGVDCKVVLIHRHPLDSEKAFKKLFPAIDWNAIEARYSFFQAFMLRAHPPQNLLCIDYEDMDSYDTISVIAKFCTGHALGKERYRLFDGLRIEQHIPKAKERTAMTDVA